MASSREKPVSDPVTTIVRPSSVRSMLASRSSAIRTPAARHLSTIARCQSTVNHSMTAAAMVGPTPSTAASCSSEAASMASRLPNSRGQRPRRGRPDVADRQRHQHPPQRLLLGLAQVGQQPLAVGRQLAGLGGEQLGAQQVVLGEGEQVALVGDHLGLQQRDAGLVAEPLDVERAAAGDVEHPLPQLRRAATGSSGSGCRRRPPWPAPAWCRTRDTLWA